MLFILSVVIEKPLSGDAPPKVLTQTKLPEVFNLTTKISCAPTEIIVFVLTDGSKSAVPAKNPVIITLFELSRASEFASSFEVPPIALAQIKLPEASNLDTKTSLLPGAESVNVEPDGSKSTVPAK
jgi:hypothetical protein